MVLLVAGAQSNLFSSPNDDLGTAVVRELGGREIFGEEKAAFEKELQRQEVVKKKIKKWLSWYGRN